MAAHRPEAVLDLNVSASHPIQEVKTVATISNPSLVSTITTSRTTSAVDQQTLNTHYDPTAHPPLRPPRGSTAANLVQPKHELPPTPAPAAAASAKTLKCTPAAAVVGGGVVGVRKSTCPQCTNISIMQLFYEMKQKFPSVSDDLVNDCVLDHCHDKATCLAILQEHSESNQSLIPQSSYPAKSLRGSAESLMGGGRKRGGQQLQQGAGGDAAAATCDSNNRQSNTNTIPRRSKGAVGAAIVAAAVPLVGMVSGANGASHFRRQSDTNNPKQAAGASSDMLSNGGSFLSNNIQRMAISGSSSGSGSVARPCTLNLAPAPNRPFRTAPPIPSTTSSTSSLSSLSTATDLASASSPQLTASNESINVSVNVTLSPILTPPRSTTGHVSHVSKPPIPPRHTTELTVQPEMLPFATTISPGRSFTSVNFTLRQPPANTGTGSGNGGGGEGTSAGYPINISTAGSSMTYSSSSYNARQGYQSQLQITVGNGGGSISAIRTKAPQTPAMVTTTTATGSRNLLGTNTTTTPTRLDADTEEVLINRQLQSKWKLSTELDKYRKRLDTMQRDVRALEMPLPASAPDQLQEEIKRLQTVCDRMAAAVEEAGNFALGETNEAFYQRLDSQPGTSNTAPAQRSPLHPTSTGQPTTTTIGSPATGAAEGIGNAVQDNEAETEGWTCSQCTFQNHPELNMCEQCGMMKRPIVQHRSSHQLQQQHQQPHPPPAGIVQITSSQFIPALGQNAAAAPYHNPNPTNAHLMPNTNMSPYMPGYHPTQQQSPRIIYSSPMCQYPSAYAYPTVTSSASAASSPTLSGGTSSGAPGLLSPPAIVVGKSSKGKRGASKFNSKLSQSISNLFSSSSSSTGNSQGHSHVNSQE